jgi:hypothetical protein
MNQDDDALDTLHRTPLFSCLRSTLLALAEPSRPCVDGPNALAEALDLALLDARFLAITPKGPALGRTGRKRRYFPPFRWQVESAAEAREVLTARGLWPSWIDEWRSEPTRFRRWEQTTQRMIDNEHPTLAEVVSIAAHASSLVDLVLAFEGKTRRAARLVLHGFRPTMDTEHISLGVRVHRDALVVQYPRPWGYGLALRAMKRGLQQPAVRP